MGTKIQGRENNTIQEGDGVGGIAAMHSEPEHAEHPPQDCAHLHFALHGWGRELQNDLQTPALLLFSVVAPVQCVHKCL